MIDRECLQLCDVHCEPDSVVEGLRAELEKDQGEARSGRWTKEGWRSSMKVYVIEDEKYGTQAVFLKDEDAQKAMDSGEYDVSGLGCAVIEFELILPREGELRR